MRRVLRARRKGRAVAAATAVVVALAVAGCTGGSDSDDDAEDPSTPSDTSTATGPTDDATEAALQPPELPAEAQEPDADGAEAFARFYVDVMNYAQDTGDTDLLASLANEDCAACDGYEQAAAEGNEGDSFIEGGDLVLRETSFLPADYASDLGVYLVLDVADQVVHLADGSQLQNDAYEYRIGLYPVWEGGGWVVSWIAVPDDVPAS